MSPTVVNPDNPDATETPGDATESPSPAPKKAKKGKKKGKSTAAATGATEATEAPYYCPGCGRRHNFLRECVGTGAAPHPAIEVVSTDELSGDPSKHTPAPDSPGA